MDWATFWAIFHKLIWSRQNQKEKMLERRKIEVLNRRPILLSAYKYLLLAHFTFLLVLISMVL
jgi:hypothetical protein